MPPGFVFTIKGGRVITHNLKLRNCDAALGNFFASGILALGEATGPFLWQLPATYSFDARRMDDFMRMLPRTSIDGEAVCEEFYDILRSHRFAFVIADTAGKFAFAPEVTADFVYVRLHGSTALYASDYTDDELDAWAPRSWVDARREGP